jgi:hypothetical protein
LQTLAEIQTLCQFFAFKEYLTSLQEEEDRGAMKRMTRSKACEIGMVPHIAEVEEMQLLGEHQQEVCFYHLPLLSLSVMDFFPLTT